jgi:hypothetical protein
MEIQNIAILIPMKERWGVYRKPVEISDVREHIQLGLSIICSLGILNDQVFIGLLEKA